MSGTSAAHTRGRGNGPREEQIGRQLERSKKPMKRSKKRRRRLFRRLRQEAKDLLADEAHYRSREEIDHSYHRVESRADVEMADADAMDTSETDTSPVAHSESRIEGAASNREAEDLCLFITGLSI